MNRRVLLPVTVVLAVLALVATVLTIRLGSPSQGEPKRIAHSRPSSASPSSTSPSPSRGYLSTSWRNPNIVVVLTDDLSSDLLPYMPHVQALARRGMSFTRYIVSDSLCCPSRASILTGSYPHTTRVLGNGPPVGGYHRFLRRHEDRHTFATLLAQQGYRTAFLGKYLNGYQPWRHTGPQRDSVPRGWSSWGGIGDGYAGYDYRMNLNGRVVRHRHRPRDFTNTVLQRRALRFLGQTHRRREAFLLEVASFSPHAPYAAGPGDRGTFPGVMAPRPRSFNRLPSHPPSWLVGRVSLSPTQVVAIDRAQQRRVASVQSVDRMVGALERRLQQSGQLSNTYFVFTSDNGYHMGTHRLFTGKLTPYDSDIRVPLIVAGPGIRPGARNGRLVQNVDLAPTIAALAGVPAGEVRMEGRPINPMLFGRPTPWRRLALVEHHGPVSDTADPDYQGQASGNPPTYAALRGRWFLFVRYRSGEVEYYDLRRDPWEIHNLAGRLPRARVESLTRALERFHHCRGSGCWAAGRPG